MIFKKFDLGDFMRKKKTKEQKPSGKYPALFYQERNSVGEDILRIIYPDGRTEWRFSGTQDFDLFRDGSEIIGCCWAGKCFNFQEQIQAMHLFDIERGNPPAIYLGELK